MKRLNVSGIALCWLLAGCTPSEIRGTYDVEIEVAYAAAPISGTLVLSTSLLDIPALGADAPNLDELLLGNEDELDANSCFIIHRRKRSGGGRAAPAPEEGPANVRVFPARIRNGEVDTPIEIFRTGDQRIELTKVKFFANAIGGEVVLYEPEGERPGRFHGVRTGDVQGQYCVDELIAFRARIVEMLESARASEN